jgi:hypothetical protein
MLVVVQMDQQVGFGHLWQVRAMMLSTCKPEAIEVEPLLAEALGMRWRL